MEREISPLTFKIMIIKEKDFNILCEYKCYTLSVITKSGAFKPAGYYMQLESAIKAVIRFRNDKKYPGKESAEELKEQLKEYLKIQGQLNYLAESIYIPINN